MSFIILISDGRGGAHMLMTLFSAAAASHITGYEPGITGHACMGKKFNHFSDPESRCRRRYEAS
jgi:hypothetical protein